MKGDAKPLLKYLDGSDNRYVIPVYQRNYDWQERQCRQLFDDLVQIVKQGRKSHFFGSIVSSQASGKGKDNYLIIDGQQRITTISLLFLAMVNLAEAGRIVPEDQSLPRKIKNKFLVDEYQPENNKLRLKPIKKDREAFDRLFKDESGYVRESTLTANYLYFCDRILQGEVSFGELYSAVGKLQIVDIFLDGDDDPQLIFESLNSTGLDLTEGDKIRNFILMGLDVERQDLYYEKYWSPIEEATNNQVSQFVRHFLTFKQNRIPNIANVYAEFKDFVQRQRSSDDGAGVEMIVEELKEFADYYSMAINAATGLEDADTVLARLNQMNFTVFHPFLLALLGRWKKGEIADSDVTTSLKCIESYLLRRLICEKPTNALNKVFCALDSDVMRWRNDEGVMRLSRGNSYADILIYVLGAKQGSSVFPKDAEFEVGIKTKNAYSLQSRNRAYLFERLENGDTKERVNVIDMLKEQKFSIEHIMPQTLSERWKAELGPDWEELFETRLHTLANLTLTGYNSEYSNRPFVEKKTIKDGFIDSHLNLNSKLINYEKWTRAEMDDRQDWIVARMKSLWEYPSTSFEPPEPPVEVVTLEHGDALTNRDLVSFTFLDSGEQSVGSWREMFIKVIKQLHDENPNIMAGFAEDSHFAEVAFAPGPKENEWEKIASNIYVNKSNSTAHKMRILNKMFVGYGKDPADLEFSLRPKSAAESEASA